MMDFIVIYLILQTIVLVFMGAGASVKNISEKLENLEIEKRHETPKDESEKQGKS